MYSAIEAFFSIFEKGGPVLMIIFFQFILMWYFAMDKYVYFKSEFPKDFAKFKNKIQNLKAQNQFLLESKIQKETSLLKEQINKNFAIIKVLVMVCPLLGLLGTVTGMVSVFDVLAVAGSGNARAMASGISKATIPTMGGMIGALAGLFLSKILKDHATKCNEMVQDFLNQMAIARTSGHNKGVISE